jgi:hypothetical protein
MIVVAEAGPTVTRISPSGKSMDGDPRETARPAARRRLAARRAKTTAGFE